MARRTKRLPDIATLRELFTYDELSGAVLRQADQYAGYVNNIGYRQICTGGRIYSAHRVAWMLIHGEEPDGEVDHINGNRSDNRIQNLRLVTSAEQNRNRRLGSRNKSGIKGVCWESARRKWRATVGSWPNLTLVGRFDDLHEAQVAVMAARERLHGAFTNHGA